MIVTKITLLQDFPHLAGVKVTETLLALLSHDLIQQKPLEIALLQVFRWDKKLRNLPASFFYSAETFQFALFFLL